MSQELKASDAELRAINAWHRFFYPNAESNFFIGDWREADGKDDFTGMGLEMGDCIRLLLAERGIAVERKTRSTPLRDPGGDIRHQLCLLIEAKCPDKDVLTNLALGRQVEALADAILAALPSQTAGEGGWLPIDSAPKDGTIIELIVDYTDGDHPLADATRACTIGFNGFDDTGEDEWKFAGWCWSHDHFTEGRGTPIAWRPSRLNASDDGLPPLPEAPSSLDKAE